MSELSETLLRWYDGHSRTLPWRGERDPYRIWLSEIMLQQTRTETVERYYARFLERFPAVRALAEAGEDEVLKYWEGLGYYSRARNLHAAARRVAFDLNGRFPETAEGLRALPGVGPYAANAIASIAFGECAPALDGNQARVLSRITAHEDPLNTPFDLLADALAFMDAARPGDYNQALMDLGASVCTPKRPDCPGCPLRGLCRAFQSGDPEDYPKKKPPLIRKELDYTVAVVFCRGRLCVCKRPGRGLLGGLYAFPMPEGFLSESEAADALAWLGFEGVRMLGTLPASKHVFTHLVWHMRGLLCVAENCPAPYIAVGSPDEVAFPSALRVYREAAESHLSKIKMMEDSI